MGSSFQHLRSADMFLTLEKLYLELIYLLKELSEFGINDILMKVKCNVIQGIWKIFVKLLNWVGRRNWRFLKNHRSLAHLAILGQCLRALVDRAIVYVRPRYDCPRRIYSSQLLYWCCTYQWKLIPPFFIISYNSAFTTCFPPICHGLGSNFWLNPFLLRKSS